MDTGVAIVGEIGTTSKVEVSMVGSVGATSNTRKVVFKIVDGVGAAFSIVVAVELDTAIVVEVTAPLEVATRPVLGFEPKAGILSTALSAAIIMGAEGLVATWLGKTEASTTNYT